jgi:ABC-2 type transport system permease protein
MSIRITGATAKRVLTQLLRDRRTMALVLGVPVMLLLLLRYVFDGAPAVALSGIALPMIAVFPFAMMFIITSVAMLRERQGGTLERLLTTPMSKLDLLLGYAIAFALTAAIQATLTTAVAYWLFSLDLAGSPGTVVGIAVADAVLGMAMGLLVSAFARNEFQAVQFMPLFVMPQVFLCGLFAPRDTMATILEKLSDVLPLTYAVDALTQVREHADITADLAIDLTVVIGLAFGFLLLGAATLRRRTA